MTRSSFALWFWGVSVCVGLKVESKRVSFYVLCLGQVVGPWQKGKTWVVRHVSSGPAPHNDTWRCHTWVLTTPSTLPLVSRRERPLKTTTASSQVFTVVHAQHLNFLKNQKANSRPKTCQKRQWCAVSSGYPIITTGSSLVLPPRGGAYKKHTACT